tara:strand:+ start:568 stop:1230 length:663 start_codon:yes stop_codon:yes gene_type:complete
MSILNKLKGAGKLPEIGGGVHENCVVTAVTGDTRKKKDGSMLRRNGYTKFGQLNSKGVVVAEREISWFNVDSSSDRAYDNFFSQLDQMTEILDIYYPVTKKEDKWGTYFSAVLEQEEVEETAEAIKEALADKETCENLMEALTTGYVELLSKVMGPDSTKVRLKFVLDTTGVFIQQPRYDRFIELNDTKEADQKVEYTDADKENHAKSVNITPAVPNTHM